MTTAIKMNPNFTHQPATYFPAPKTYAQSAYVNRIMARAARLTADGYRITQIGKSTGFAIFKPGNTETRAAYRDYKVEMCRHQISCTCEFFAENKKSCKHIEAVRLEIALTEENEAMWEKICDDMDARAELEF